MSASSAGQSPDTPEPRDEPPPARRPGEPHLGRRVWKGPDGKDTYGPWEPCTLPGCVARAALAARTPQPSEHADIVAVVADLLDRAELPDSAICMCGDSAPCGCGDIDGPGVANPAIAIADVRRALAGERVATWGESS